MTVYWPLALLTFKEGIRNRALYGISLIAFLFLGANVLISGSAMREIGKVAVDMALSTISFTGLLLVLFIGINLMAKDLDKRTIYMVLSRPISRPQYIVGKFFGMALLIVVTIAVLSVFGMLSIIIEKWAYPDYFPRFFWGPIFLAVLFAALSLILLSAVSFFFASFSSSSFLTLILTIMAYIIGQSLSDVKALVEAPQTAGITVSPVTHIIVQAAYYLFPNLSLFDLKIQAAHGLAVSPSYVGWTALYGLAYTCLMLFFAALIFRKKEFP